MGHKNSIGMVDVDSGLVPHEYHRGRPESP